MNNRVKAPKVSVCVITYNQQRYIGQCLQSLVDQQTRFDFEIIVADDCSSDDTAAIVQQFVQRYPGLVKLVRQQRNTGGSRNNLEVHAAATGEYVAHVDGDDYALPGKLQAQADVLDADPACTAVWHSVDYFDDEGGFCSGDTADLRSFEGGRVTFPDAIRLGFIGVHSSLMYRRSARTPPAPDRHILDIYGTLDLLSKGHGHIIERVLGRYRVGASGSLMAGRQRRSKLLSIEHADEFLRRFPQMRGDFLIWALCRALVEAKNRQATVFAYLGFAGRTLAPVRLREVWKNLDRMRRTQVAWRLRERRPSTGR